MSTLTSKQIERMNRVYNYLSEHGQGKENAVTRQRLCVGLSLDDRKLRETITDLRKNGALIGSSSDTTGYWLCQTAAEAREVINVYKSYARDLEATVRALEATCKSRYPFEQMRIA